ncbi:MAG: response regulator [Oscillospiraceae bacterium]|jgi:signal transduction histidine kinase/PAS domain-containing protein|nr:response regulator [Oscillospiraceae bacterium]
MFAEINAAYLIALLFFLTSLGYVYTSIVTIVSDSKSRLRREYLIAVICVVLSSFFYGLMTIAENEKLVRICWAAGFTSYFLFLPVWIRFASNMITIKSKAVKHMVRWAFIAITVIISAVCIASSDVVFIETPYGMQFSYSNSWVFRAMAVFVFVLCIGVFTTHIRWWRASESKRQRRQQFMFVLLTFLLAPAGFVTDFFIPSFTDGTVPPLVSVLLFPASLHLFISMRTNKTLSITVPNVAEYIFKSVTIPTLVLDQHNTICLENNAALELLGENSAGKNISELIFLDGKALEQSDYNDNFENKKVSVLTPSGVRTCIMLLIVEKDKFQDALCKVVIIRDITRTVYWDNLLQAVNRSASLLLNSDMDSFEDQLHQSMEIIAGVVGVDCVYLWKNHTVEGALFCSQVFEWSPQQTMFADGTMYSYDDVVPGWKETLSDGGVINGLVRDMSQLVQDHLTPSGILSILVTPVFIEDQFWGFVGFDDCHKERIFTESEVTIMCSASLQLAYAFVRNEMVLNIRETSSRLETALTQAEAASKAKGDFLSTMSHEMRTPMNAIIGMTAIGKKAERAEEKNSALDKIEDASSHLLGLISDILDMAKIEANKFELAAAEFHFEKMLQTIATIAQFRVDEKRQTLTVSVDDGVPAYVVGDGQRLAQVITNLLSNAVKFTQEEGIIRLSASLAGEADGHCELRIEVADNGIGISPEKQEALFLAFEQVESGTSRDYGGTGLGLPIAERIVRLMGGRMWVESELGKGARFIFTVTVLRGKGQGDGGSENAETDTDGAAGGEFAGKRLLLAEDIEINRDILIALLEDTSISIDCAENGQEALDMVASDPKGYDIVLMDIQMPKMDGLEATRRIRDLPALSGAKLPIIAVTANVFKDDIEACLAAGMDDHVGKPVDMDKLLDKMRHYML